MRTIIQDHSRRDRTITVLCLPESGPSITAIVTLDYGQTAFVSSLLDDEGNDLSLTLPPAICDAALATLLSLCDPVWLAVHAVTHIPRYASLRDIYFNLRPDDPDTEAKDIREHQRLDAEEYRDQ